MREKRAAVFAAGGIGDGLLMAIAAYNLHCVGYHVTLFHPLAKQLASFFPSYAVDPYLPSPSMEKSLSSFQHIIIQNNYSSYADFLMHISKKRRPTIFHTASRTFSVDKERPQKKSSSIAKQIAIACQKLLSLPNVIMENGMTAPKVAKYHRLPKQIVIHPTGSHPEKCWIQKKFLLLALQLEIAGFSPIFAVPPSEREKWLNIVRKEEKVPYLPDLNALARLLYESYLFIGNDSGPGHLASNLRIQTVTIARNQTKITLWRPGWEKGKIVTPSPFIPNIKGLRWRDSKWQQFISTKKVLRTCLALLP